MPDQQACSPERGGSKYEQQPRADDSVIDCAFAPALEHGDQSSDEEENGKNGKTLDPHMRLCSEAAMQANAGKGQGSRWMVIGLVSRAR